MENRTDQIVIGDDVIGADGAKLGKVAQVYPGYIVVEKGFFFPTDYYIPRSTMRHVGDNQISLTVSGDDTLKRGWDRLPDDLQMDVIAETASVDAMTGAAASRLEWDTTPTDGVAITSRMDVADQILLPLMQEELTATVRSARAGAIRVSRSLVTEQRGSGVPATEEQIRVKRRIVDGSVDPTVTNAFEEIVIEIPLRPEEVDLYKEDRMGEEIFVTKQTVRRIERVSGTVRREEIVVDEDPRGGTEKP